MSAILFAEKNMIFWALLLFHPTFAFSEFSKLRRNKLVVIVIDG